MTAQELKEAVSKYYIRKRMCIHFEVGLCKKGRLRADVVGLSMRGNLVGIEVKSGRSDFMRDSKWPQYTEYFNKFYFAMTLKTYEAVKAHIPKGIGIMVVTPRISTVTGRPLVGSVKAVQSARMRDVDPDIAKNMIIRMAFKSSDRNRFSSVSVRT